MSPTSSFFQSVRSQRAVAEVYLFQSSTPNDMRERVDIAFADVKEPLRKREPISSAAVLAVNVVVEDEGGGYGNEYACGPSPRNSCNCA